jgi:hypothetical protein
MEGRWQGGIKFPVRGAAEPKEQLISIAVQLASTPTVGHDFRSSLWTVECSDRAGIVHVRACAIIVIMVAMRLLSAQGKCSLIPVSRWGCQAVDGGR